LDCYSKTLAISEGDFAMTVKDTAFIMMLVAIGFPLIFGLRAPQGGLDSRFIAGLLLVILGLCGTFIYLEQSKREIIAALKDKGGKN
jgi:hypothetical protein